MSDEPKHLPVPGDLTASPIGKVVLAISWLVFVTLMMAITSTPSVLLLMFLNPEVPGAISNALIIILALTLLGPALSAGLYAARARTTDEVQAPAKAFWRGYRMNFFDVLRFWFPASIVVGVMIYSIGVATALGMGIGIIALVAILVALAIIALHALALATFINMSTGGIVRLALLYLGRSWKTSLAVLALIIVAGGIAGFVPGGIFAVVVASGLWIAFWYQQVKPMIADATANYTVQGQAPHDAV
ncbi:MAG: DUF624 domain-containing protein [Promicromonosporaceae bacterium]|nr:DUF624 domain-containing protein [Promicromonosporaceae bacterium]